MIEFPLLFTGIQILPHVLIKRVVAGSLVTNMKICGTTVAFANADGFDAHIGMLPEEVSANEIIARWAGARSRDEDA